MDAAIERFMTAVMGFAAARVMAPLNDNQRAMLGQDLDASVVRTRKQAGQTLSYVGGEYVIARLNDVFGFDGWSVAYGAPTVREGDRPVIYVPVTLTAAGISRGDVGVGLAATNSGDAFETAIKAAYTDGLKRAARTLGNTLGLALYEKDASERAVGWGYEAQTIIQAYDAATTADGYKAARSKLEAAWERLPEAEQKAVQEAQKRAADRIKRAGGAADAAPTQTATRPTSGAAGATPAPAAAPPLLSPSVKLAVARIALARNARTVAAAILACEARGTAAAPVDDAVAARRAAGVDLGDLEQKLDAARKLEAPREQWNDVAAILSSVDQVESAASLGALRKEVAARVLALPAALQSGVKAAVDARAAELGAPTVASQLLVRAKAAKDETERQKVYDEMTAAAQARRITKADAEAITAILNGERAAA